MKSTKKYVISVVIGGKSLYVYSGNGKGRYKTGDLSHADMFNSIKDAEDLWNVAMVDILSGHEHLLGKIEVKICEISLSTSKVLSTEVSVNSGDSVCFELFRNMYDYITKVMNFDDMTALSFIADKFNVDVQDVKVAL